MSTLAILSDTHDQIGNLAAAIEVCNQQHVSTLIHCGDLISPFMLKQLAKFNGVVHLIYGNNVGDQHVISTECATIYPNITHHGIQGSITFCGKEICFVHYPQFARALASQGMYDIVCCGHNHRQEVSYIGSTLYLNPGQLLGEDARGGFILLNCQDMSAQQVRITNSMQNHTIDKSIEPLQIDV